MSLASLQKNGSDGHLFAIVDACDEPTVPAKIAEKGAEKSVSLYRGSAEEHYWAIAPYLTLVDNTLLDWILHDLWQRPWGIFVVSKSDLSTLRTHFRKILVVESPNNTKLYFRYYDPRVLDRFIPICTPDQLDQIFGPVLAYGVGKPESPGSGSWIARID